MANIEIPEGFRLLDEPSADPSVPQVSNIPEGFRLLEEEDAVEKKEDDSDTFVPSLKRGTGQVLGTFGRLTGADTLAEYGEGLVRENKAKVEKLSDIPGNVGTLAVETAGELAPDIAGQAAATAAGAGLGLAVGGPIAPVTAAAGAAIGRYGYSFARSYDSIKQQQQAEIAKGNLDADNEVRAILSAAVAAGIDFVAPVSKVAGNLGRAIFTKGREEVIKEITEAAPETLTKYGMKVVGGAAGETAQEMSQEGLETYGAKGKVEEEDLGQIGFAGVKGGLGGGAVTAVETPIGMMKKSELKAQKAAEEAKKKREAAKAKAEAAKTAAEVKLETVQPEDLSVDQALELSKLKLEREKWEAEKEAKAFDEQARKAVEEENLLTEEKEGRAKRLVAEQEAASTALQEKPESKELDEFEANRSYETMRKEAAQRKAEEAAAAQTQKEAEEKAKLTRQAKKYPEGIGQKEGIDQEAYEETVAAAKADTKFSGTKTRPSTPFSRQKVEELANKFVKDWVVKPDIVVFDDFDTDPRINDETRMLAKERGLEEPAAFKVGATIYLNSKRIGSVVDIQREMSHEGVGHIAVELYNEKTELDNVYDNVFKERQKDVQAFVSGGKYDVNNPDHRREIASEIVANIAQKDPKNSLVRAAIVAIRNWMRSKGIKIKLRDMDIIENYILPAKNYIQKGQVKTKSGIKNLGERDQRTLEVEQAEGNLIRDEKAKQIADDAYEELDRRQRLEKMKDEGATAFSGKPSAKELIKVRQQIQRELDTDQHLSQEDISRLEKHLKELDEEIYDANLRGMKEMVKGGKKPSTRFQHDKDGDKPKLESVPKKAVKEPTSTASEMTTEEAQQLTEEPSEPDNFPAKLKPELREAANENINDKESIRSRIRELMRVPSLSEAQEKELTDLRVRLKDLVEGPAGSTRFQNEIPEEMDSEANILVKTGRAAHNLIRSVADRLKDGDGLVHQLGVGIQNLVDNEQVNRGMIQKNMLSISKTLEKHPKSKEIVKEFDELAKAIVYGDKAEVNALTESADPVTLELMAAVRESLDSIGKKMSDLGMRATDPKTGKKVPFKMRPDFIPSILLPKYRAAITNPLVESKSGKTVYSKEFKEVADQLIDNNYKDGDKVIKTHDDAYNFFQKALAEGNFESGFYGDMGMSRDLPLPPEAYDHSLDAIRKYMDRAAERLAQVEAFTITNEKGDRVDLFDEVLKKDGPLPEGDKRRDYIHMVKNLVYQDKFHHGEGERFVTGLNTLATGLQISGPKSVLTNFMGGLTNLFAFADISSSIKAMQDFLDPDIRAAVTELVNNNGIVSDNTFRVLTDSQDMGLSKYAGLNQAYKRISNFTSHMMSFNKLGPLKNISFNKSENSVRLLSALVAKNQVDSWIREFNSNPYSAKSKVFQKIANEEGINIEALLEETGFYDIQNSPQTSRFYRRLVNRMQGSYRLDQVPAFLDTAWGKFLFKYNKYGFQLGRMFDKQVIQYIKDPDTRSEGFKNLLKYAAVTGSMGYINAQIVSALFGDEPLPDEEEMEKIFMEKAKNKGYLEAVTYALGIWRNSMHILGAFGPISLAARQVDQYRDFGGSPISAPGLAPLQSLSSMLGKWMWSKDEITGDDILADVRKLLLANIAPARQVIQAGTELTDTMPYLKAKRIQYRTRQAIDRFLKDHPDLERKTPDKGWTPDIAAPERMRNKVLNDSIETSLLIGDYKKAKETFKKSYDKAKNKYEQGNMETAISNSILARRPFNVFTKPAGKVATKYFDDWAKAHLPEEDYKEMKALDDLYMRAAVKAELIKKDQIRESTYRRAVKRYEKATRPFKKEEE